MKETPITSEDVRATVQTIKAVADAIKELKTAISGHLYAVMMPYCSLEQFQKIIGILERAQLITVRGDILTWNLNA